MDGHDSSKVYFRCNVCEYTFQENPDMFPIKCFQCSSEDVSRF
ncbi:hypothetical protein [Methanolobus halotolerans]|nr:hypothetical protein [Methanolobus halotolerans]